MCTVTYLHYNNLQCTNVSVCVVENLKTCERAFFTGQTCEKPCEMGVCLAAACMQLPYAPPPPTLQQKNTMLKSDFCPCMRVNNID